MLLTNRCYELITDCSFVNIALTEWCSWIFPFPSNCLVSWGSF